MSEEFPIRPSSGKAAMNRQHLFAKKHDFPFDRLTMGMSFEVPDGTVPINTLRASAVREGKKLNRNFSVIRHPGCYEVAYVSDRVTKVESKVDDVPLDENGNPLKPWGG